jgi:hypothetical protein
MYKFAAVQVFYVKLKTSDPKRDPDLYGPFSCDWCNLSFLLFPTGQNPGSTRGFWTSGNFSRIQVGLLTRLLKKSMTIVQQLIHLFTLRRTMLRQPLCVQKTFFASLEQKCKVCDS